MTRRGIMLIFSFVVITMTVPLSWGKSLQPLESIEQAVYLHTMELAHAKYDMPQIVVGELDSRLRLQACSTELETFLPRGQVSLGHQTMGVKCTGETPWTVYVPVNVKLMQPVVVASRPLPARHILTEQDLTVRMVDVSRLRNTYFSDRMPLTGQQLKHSVSVGAVIGHNNVKPEKIIRRGEMITLVAEAGSMQVKMNGTALSDAVLGQKIRVKNSSSKRVVEGIVQAPGLVKVSL